MKYAVTGCLIPLLSWLVLAIVMSLGFQALGFALADTVFVSVVGALLGLIGMGLLRSSWQARQQSLGVESGMVGAQPKDGAQVVIVGVITSNEADLLVAPITGARCVAYSYRVTETRGSGKSRTTVTHVRGSALIPSTISAPGGSYKLLAVPDLQSAQPTESNSMDPRTNHKARVETFRRYLQTTRFTTTSKEAAKELTDQWADADGQYRGDVLYTHLDDLNLANCKLEQQHIAPGAQVCVFGTFSAEKSAIVPSSAWHGRPRLMEGGADVVAAKLRTSARNRLIAGLIFCGAVAGLVAFVLGIEDVGAWLNGLVHPAQ